MLRDLGVRDVERLVALGLREVERRDGIVPSRRLVEVTRVLKRAVKQSASKEAMSEVG